MHLGSDQQQDLDGLIQKLSYREILQIIVQLVKSKDLMVIAWAAQVLSLEMIKEI